MSVSLWLLKIPYPFGELFVYWVTHHDGLLWSLGCVRGVYRVCTEGKNGVVGRIHSQIMHTCHSQVDRHLLLVSIIMLSQVRIPYFKLTAIQFLPFYFIFFSFLLPRKVPWRRNPGARSHKEHSHRNRGCRFEEGYRGREEVVCCEMTRILLRSICYLYLLLFSFSFYIQASSNQLSLITYFIYSQLCFSFFL